MSVSKQHSAALSSRCFSFVFSTLLMLGAGAAQALSNAGFESDLTAWQATSGAADIDLISAPGEDCSAFLAYQNVNCDPGNVIAVITGEQMVRLGSPKVSSESQDQTPLQLTSNPFVTGTTNLTLAARLFSYEFRGDDQFVVEVIDATTLEPLFGPSISLDFGSAGSCAGTNPCVITIDIGKRSNKKPFDSATLEDGLNFNGARDIEITDLPLGENIRLRYTLNPSNNEAHPTWIFLDNRNSPPNAVIEFGPGDSRLTDADVFGNVYAGTAIEGDFVSANCNASSDPENDQITCNWRAWGGGLNASAENPLVQNDTNEAVFYFPDDAPQATIELTVSDGQAPDVVESVTVNLLNAQPVVGALDLEVIADVPGMALCRFADAGIGTYGSGGTLALSELGESCGTDTTAACSADSVVDITGTLIEKRVEHVAEFSSGFAVSEITVSEDTTASCVVTDKDGESTAATINVTVIDDAALAEREPINGNDTAEQADVANACEGSVCPCEINNSCAAAGSNYLAKLESADDLDVFVLRNANGGKFKANSDVLITLDVPADYELMIVARLAPGLVDAPFLSSPRIGAPFFGSTFQSAPFFGSTFNQAPFFNSTFNQAPFFGSTFARADNPVAAPFFSSTFQTAPFFNSTFSPIASPFFNTTFAGADAFDTARFAYNALPLSKVGLALPSPDGISGKDIDLSDTGSLSTLGLQGESNLQVVEISANLAGETEGVMFKATGNVVEYYAVVFSSYGSFTAAPYSLKVEASEPPSQETLWANSDYCASDETFMTQGAYPAPSGGPVSGSLESAQTLIITQKERFETVYPGADVNDLIQDISNRLPGSVAVVSVPPAWFADADFYPCRVSTRNDLLARVKDTFIVNPTPDPDTGEVEFRSSQLQNIVVLGDNSVVPFYARLDTSLVGNESDYAAQVSTLPGSWTTTAIAEGYNLTYSFLADKQGIDFEGDKLWLEDVPISVLVGDPGTVAEPGPLRREIAAIGAFSDRSVISGYEAFADSAQMNESIIGGSKQVLIDPDENPNPWTAQQLRDEYNNDVLCDVESPQPLAFVNLQAHMTEQLLLSSQGYRVNDFTDAVSVFDGKNCLDENTTTLSLGCHSGLEIAKLQTAPAAPGQFDPASDWVDEVGAMIAPTGYGLGDRFVADRVTEGLLTRTLEKATTLNVSLPRALMLAKQDYLLEVSDFDAHDADALMVLTAYMMPNFTLNIPAAEGALAALNAQTSFASGSCATLPSGGVLDLTFYNNGVPSGSDNPSYDCIAPAGFGEYSVLSPGGASGAYNRPLGAVTRTLQGVPITPMQPYNDVLLINREAPQLECADGAGGLRPCRIAARFQDTENVDPVFSFPETNWSQPPDSLLSDYSQNELDSCVPNLAPFPLSYFTTVGNRQTQHIRGTQFRCEEELSTSVPGGVRGTHRQFGELYLDALQANVAGGDANPAPIDQNPPQATTLEFFANPETNNVVARIAATDEATGDSQICEITALVFFENVDGAGSGYVESYSSRYDTTPTYTGDVTVPYNEVVEFNLLQARGQRLASQICDCDGNCVFKTLKGGLLIALDVQVVSLLLQPGELQILVESEGPLEFPTLELEVCPPGILPGAAECANYIYDLTEDNPIFTVEETDGQTLITVFGLANSGDAVTATVRSRSSFGTDTATLTACIDPIGDTNGFVDGDIASCGVRYEGAEIALDLRLVDDDNPIYNVGGVLNEDVKYRLDFVNLSSGQIQYFQGINPDLKGRKGGKVSGGPSGWDDVRAIKDGNEVRGLSYVFTESDFINMGWTGGAVQIRFETQSGVPGSPTQGKPDETSVFEFTPSFN